MPAAWRGYSDVAKLLLDNGADTEAKDEYGATSLIISASEGHLETVKELLAAKANIHAKDKNGWTPWLWAFSAGHAEVVKLPESPRS